MKRTSGVETSLSPGLDWRKTSRSLQRGMPWDQWQWLSSNLSYWLFICYIECRVHGKRVKYLHWLRSHTVVSLPLSTCLVCFGILCHSYTMKNGAQSWSPNSEPIYSLSNILRAEIFEPSILKIRL